MYDVRARRYNVCDCSVQSDFLSSLAVFDVCLYFFFFFQAEDGIRDLTVTGVQTCALPISHRCHSSSSGHGNEGVRSTTGVLVRSTSCRRSPTRWGSKSPGIWTESRCLPDRKSVV